VFGIGIDALQGHGLTDALLDIARNWKRVSRLISDEQREKMRNTLFLSPDIVEQAGSHEKSEWLHVLTQGVGEWAIHPTRVLTRRGNVDTTWHDGQEHGAISPRQFVKKGDTLELMNPLDPQPPRIQMRLLWAFDAKTAANTADASGEASSRNALSDFDYERMNRDSKRGEAFEGNQLLQPKAGEFRNPGDIQISDDGEALVLRLENSRQEPLVNEHTLPEWSRTLNMRSHRGVGLWVTGDNSGAILVIQIPGGDYVVPIDFTGRRYVEIPNAQVAWSTGYWGWRMGSKRTYYDNVTWLKMGIGYLPAGRAAEVRVEQLTALNEHPVELRNPRFSIGDTTLEAEGVLSSGQYLVWEGGATCTVYDENWHKKSDLPLRRNTLMAPKGDLRFSIEGETGALLPWLEVQVMTRDEPMIIPDGEL